MITSSFLFILFLSSHGSCGSCPHGQVESACTLGEERSRGSNSSIECVDAVALLVGGSDLAGWRSDLELFGASGSLGVSVPEFPYAIDAPVGWWAKGKLVICGGRNWDLDVPESRCWKLAICQNRWEEVPGMLEKRIGAVAVVVEDKVWVIGGGEGNGSASTEILSLGNDPSQWTWKSGPPLLKARYAHCGLAVNNASEIVVIGGHSPAGVVGEVEVVDLASQTISLAPQLPHLRWGSVCLPLGGDNVAVTGGMDNLFLPHKSVDVLDTISWEWEGGQNLPWSIAGQIGIVMGGVGPTVMGGIGYTGYRRGVASWQGQGPQGGKWHVWDHKVNHARVSGLAVPVPKDLFDYC